MQAAIPATFLDALLNGSSWQTLESVWAFSELKKLFWTDIRAAGQGKFAKEGKAVMIGNGNRISQSQPQI